MSFLLFALWLVGGAILLAVAAIILGTVALELRERWIRLERRYRI